MSESPKFSDQAKIWVKMFTKPGYMSNNIRVRSTINNNQMTQEKKIIGYKLKNDCKQYEEAVLKIVGRIATPFESKSKWNFMITQIVISHLIKLEC